MCKNELAAHKRNQTQMNPNPKEELKNKIESGEVGQIFIYENPTSELTGIIKVW